MDIERQKVVDLVRKKLKEDDIDIKRDVIVKCSYKAVNNITYEIKEEEIASSVYSAIKFADASGLAGEDDYMDGEIEANDIPDLSDINNTET